MITANEMQADYHWRHAWHEAVHSCSGPDYDAKDSESGPVQDVVRVVASAAGQNDADEWICVCEMKDGRFAVMRAGCDYTGWDCQAGGSVEYHPTAEEACGKLTLTNEEQARLRDDLIASGMSIKWHGDVIQEPEISAPAAAQVNQVNTVLKLIRPAFVSDWYDPYDEQAVLLFCPENMNVQEEWKHFVVALGLEPAPEDVAIEEFDDCEMGQPYDGRKLAAKWEAMGGDPAVEVSDRPPMAWGMFLIHLERHPEVKIMAFPAERFHVYVANRWA